MCGAGYQAGPVAVRPNASKVGHPPLFNAGTSGQAKDHGLPASIRQNKGVVRRTRSSMQGRPRVARCKTWRIIDDDQPSEELPSISESFLQQGPPVSEVKVKPRDADGLTSFLPEVGKAQLETMTSDGVLSSHTDMTNFSFLDSTTLEHTLDTSTTHQTSNAEHASEVEMAPSNPQGRKRLKYKEPPTVLASSTTPNSDTQPHPPTPQEASHASAHSYTDDTPARMTEQISTPTDVTPEAAEIARALVPYSSSSSESVHPPVPRSADSAVEMGGKGTRNPHKKQQHPLTKNDQELAFTGHRSVNPSNVTNDSWRWDPVLGALVSNTSGASYQPALTSETTPVRKDGWTSDNTLEESMRAKKPVAKFTQQPRSRAIATNVKDDWAPTETNNDWTSDNKADDWAPTGQQHAWSEQANMSWDTGHPPNPSRTRQQNKEQARAPAKRVETKARKPRESPWIKDSLIPKGDPNRHKVRWSSSESSSSDSDRASSGWGTRRKRGQDNGADLADWAGGLGPGAIDWDSRSKFRDHQSVAKIENWLDQNLSALEQIGGTKEHDITIKHQGDIAPRYWFQTHLDGKSAEAFWLEQIQPRHDVIQPLERDDLKDARPWWNNYADDDHSVLKVLEQPEVADIDPDETAEERLARLHDHGSGNAGESRKVAEQAKREAQRKRTLAKRARAHKFSGTYNSTSPSTIKPGLNIFVRPAVKEDMVQLRDIYNRYIDNMFVVPETDRLTETDMLERWQAIRNANLPFIVACQRGDVIKARNKKYGGEDKVMPDKVIGFACAADWSDGTCIFRPTVKLEVFVHIEQYMKHVGSCLTDKMMGLLDPQFVERGGYDVDGEELEQGEPRRAISNVLVRYSYEAEKTDKLRWVSKWLKTRFGFEQVADLQGVAQKFDQQ